jgi:hypothetical protein
MHKYYFPRCPVEGPIEPPVQFQHLGSRGAVPKKCHDCNFLFEGECTRGGAKVGHHLHLDHGPCGIEGPTDPVVYEDQWVRGHVEIPRKCARCIFLRVDPIRGFHCTKDAKIWGDLHRGLDWGYWEPDTIWIQLPHPKITTRTMISWAKAGNLMEFIKEYRSVNLDLPLTEARADFAFIRKGLGLED